MVAVLWRSQSLSQRPRGLRSALTGAPLACPTREDGPASDSPTPRNNLPLSKKIPAVLSHRPVLEEQP